MVVTVPAFLFCRVGNAHRMFILLIWIAIAQIDHVADDLF